MPRKTHGLRLAACAALCGAALSVTLTAPVARADDDTPIIPEHAIPVTPTNVDLPVVLVNDYGGVELRSEATDANAEVGGAVGEYTIRLPETRDRLPIVFGGESE